MDRDGCGETKQCLLVLCDLEPPKIYGSNEAMYYQVGSEKVHYYDMLVPCEASSEGPWSNSARLSKPCILAMHLWISRVGTIHGKVARCVKHCVRCL